MLMDLHTGMDPDVDGRSRLLFIVEKNAAMRRILEMLMSARGWTVRSFGSAGECLCAAVKQRPDCILSDLYPADMDASEFRQAMMWKGIGSPMVILSAYPDSPVAAAIKSMGVIEILDAPCNVRMLEGAIARAMGRERLFLGSATFALA